MKKVEDLFKARTLSPLETAMLYDGLVGFTLLGTLILAQEKTKEEEFSGVSVAVVDGQTAPYNSDALCLCLDSGHFYSVLTAITK